MESSTEIIMQVSKDEYDRAKMDTLFMPDFEFKAYSSTDSIDVTRLAGTVIKKEIVDGKYFITIR